jgi:hypothetical protein
MVFYTYYGEYKKTGERMITQLLCTFTTKDTLQKTLEDIKQTYYIVYNYIYVLQNKTNLEELYITYNIDTQYKPTIPLKDTILVHRKKQSNTLYTINALNELVKEENDGKADKNFQIDWDKFRNTIIVTNTEGTKKISTRIFEVIEYSQK